VVCAVIGLDEFHQLLCLLCPDFPFSLVQNTARIDLNWTADPEQVVFGPFLDKLSLLFFYSEFMNVSAQSFKSLDTADSGKVPRQAYLSALLGLVGSKRNEFMYVYLCWCIALVLSFQFLRWFQLSGCVIAVSCVGASGWRQRF
jgi:hypothetical protein